MENVVELYHCVSLHDNQWPLFTGETVLNWSDFYQILRGIYALGYQYIYINNQVQVLTDLLP